MATTKQAAEEVFEVRARVSRQLHGDVEEAFKANNDLMIPGVVLTYGQFVSFLLESGLRAAYPEKEEQYRIAPFAPDEPDQTRG